MIDFGLDDVGIREEGTGSGCGYGNQLGDGLGHGYGHGFGNKYSHGVGYGTGDGMGWDGNLAADSGVEMDMGTGGHAELVLGEAADIGKGID